MVAKFSTVLCVYLLFISMAFAGNSYFLASPKISYPTDIQFDRALDCQSDNDPVFSKIQMISRYAEVQVDSIVLLFVDDTTEIVKFGRVMHRGRTSQWIKLKHKPLCIAGVRVVGTSLDRDLDFPQIEVRGR